MTRLSPQQSAIIDALHCMKWCDVPDLIAAGQVGSVETLRVVIHNLRRKGYRIECLQGDKARGRVGAYSLQGEP